MFHPCIAILYASYICDKLSLPLTQKLQNAKAESEREISSLKRRVQELERQLSLATKRRKL